TQEALNRAIKAVRPGRPISVIGRVIESYAKRFGYGVVRDYTGHGVHTTFHSGLVILHYDEPRMDTVMQPGMTFTIEPMLTLGTHETNQWDDDWTVVTTDGSRVAQWEHSLVVTETGAEVLTLPGRAA
ncbi:MAG TPA: M24 family metallopeptidase, partial [Arachnia sp.]|nr:M24 family metallopeptidase [Arachnia sp.]